MTASSLFRPVSGILAFAMVLFAASSHAGFDLLDRVKKETKDFTDQVKTAATGEPAAEPPSQSASSAGSSWNPPVSAEERERLNGNYTKTIMQGAAVGGALGAVVAQAKGKDSKDTAKYAAIGGVLGGFAASSVANSFEKMSQDKAASEKQIDNLSQNRQSLVAKLESVNKNIDYISGELSILKKQLARGAISKQNYQEFANRANVELTDAKNAFKKVELTYTEAQETYIKIVQSEDEGVRSLTPRADQVRRELESDYLRSQKMDLNVNKLIAEIS